MPDDPEVAVLEPDAPTPTDEVVAEPDEVVDETTDVADAPADDSDAEAQELLDALDELGPDDPLAKKLLEKLGQIPVPVEEERLEWETERERTQRQERSRAIFNRTQQHVPQATYERALGVAYDFAQQEQARIQAQAQAIARGDEGIDPDKQWVFDADDVAVKIANHVTQEAEAAFTAGQSHAATRTEDTTLTALEQSPVHKLLTKEDRAALKEAQRLPYADHRVARYTAIYLNRAIQGAGTIREGMTKAQAAAEEQKAAARERALSIIGKRMPTARGSRQNEAALLADPNTPIEKLIEIRRRQQAG